MKRTWFPLALLAFLAAPSALAHERQYTRSRDWFIPYPGEVELEARNFVDTTHGSYVGQYEVEIGIFEHFAIEPGVELRENDEGKYELEAAEMELRFNFGEFSYGSILPALNVEYEHPFESDDESSRLLGRFILSRYDRSGKDVSVNFNLGQELEDEQETSYELTAGYVMPFSEEGEGEAGWREVPRFGFEAIENFTTHHAQLGPLFVYRASEHLNLLAGYQFAINDRGENPDQLAILLEWEF